MMRPRRFCSAICLCLLLGVIASAQTAQTAAPTSSLSISGEVEKPLKLTAAELGKLPHRSVRATGHDGKEVEFEGVPLAIYETVIAGENKQAQILALILTAVSLTAIYLTNKLVNSRVAGLQ